MLLSCDFFRSSFLFCEILVPLFLDCGFQSQRRSPHLHALLPVYNGFLRFGMWHCWPLGNQHGSQAALTNIFFKHWLESNSCHKYSGSTMLFHVVLQRIHIIWNDKDKFTISITYKDLIDLILYYIIGNNPEIPKSYKNRNVSEWITGIKTFGTQKFVLDQICWKTLSKDTRNAFVVKRAIFQSAQSEITLCVTSCQFLKF